MDALVKLISDVGITTVIVAGVLVFFFYSLSWARQKADDAFARHLQFMDALVAEIRRIGEEQRAMSATMRELAERPACRCGGS